MIEIWKGNKSMKSFDKEYFQTKLNAIRCLIVGDVMLDYYIYGETTRISPEAPIPIVDVKKTKEMLGGGANVSANIRNMGCSTYLSGVIGGDSDGQIVQNLLEKKQIEFHGIISEERITSKKSRVISKGQQIVRFDQEEKKSIGFDEEECLLKQVDTIISQINLVVISDYAKGVCTDRVCQEIISKAKQSGINVIVDPKGQNWNRYTGAYIITPNWKEFKEQVGNVDLEDEALIRKKALELIERYQIENLLITRAERGMTLVTKKEFVTIPAIAREVVDVSGAGDTVVATLAALLGCGYNLKDAVYWSNIAGGIAVEKIGTSVISLSEIFNRQYNQVKENDIDKKFIQKENLLNIVGHVKQMNKNIVFTNGCFDILHSGHIQYLKEAKRLGDYLIVGINTDSSVRRQGKGKNRPINAENDRMLQIAALEMVDAVFLFEEDTPLEIIKLIKPDILVKGGDYRIEDIVGREYAKETRSLSLKEGYSTSSIIEKIYQGFANE